MDSIIEHSKLTLEELSLSYTNVNYAKLTELKRMSKLKTLNCLHIELLEIDKLKLKMPQLWINQQIKVASMGDGGSFETEEGFWEIQAKQIGTIHLRRRQIFMIFDPYPQLLDSVLDQHYESKHIQKVRKKY